MNNPFDTMRQAVIEAREVNRAVDGMANTLVDLLAGRMQNVSAYRLKALKAELRRFNANTGKWGGK